MKIESPPLHDTIRIIPALNQDPDHNSRELAACHSMAAEMGGKVSLPPGEWPMSPVTI